MERRFESFEASVGFDQKEKKKNGMLLCLPKVIGYHRGLIHNTSNVYSATTTTTGYRVKRKEKWG
jgi:hypothetical protein